MHVLNKILLVANALSALLMLYVSNYALASTHFAVIALMLAVYFVYKEKGQ